MIEIEVRDVPDPSKRPALDSYGKPATGPEAYEPRELVAGEPQLPPAEPYLLAAVAAPGVERQIDALCNKLLSLGVTREEIAAILTATAEPYVGPESP